MDMFDKAVDRLKYRTKWRDKDIKTERLDNNIGVIYVVKDGFDYDFAVFDIDKLQEHDLDNIANFIKEDYNEIKPLYMV